MTINIETKYELWDKVFVLFNDNINQWVICWIECNIKPNKTTILYDIKIQKWVLKYEEEEVFVNICDLVDNLKENLIY